MTTRLNQPTDWIAVDWGTTQLRAWAMTNDGQDLAQISAPKGMNALTQDMFEDALLDLVGPWLGDGIMPVLACGMVGAKQGWTEAPYAPTPCTPTDARVTAPTNSGRLSVEILAGVSQNSPADVMRGEETQIAGFMGLNPNWDGVICLPGTHTKWVQVSAGEIVSFQTSMTGELFGLLSDHSVLRHSVDTTEWDDDAFAASLSATLSKPESLMSKLFGIRADGLLHGATQGASRATLSGLLIGAELAATRPYWLGQSMAVIGATTLAGHYVGALSKQGAPAIQADVTQMTLAGLKAAFAKGKNP